MALELMGLGIDLRDVRDGNQVGILLKASVAYNALKHNFV